MSNTNDIVVGLDIGTTKICAIVGRKNEYGKIDILGMGKAESEGVSRGVVINIQQTVNAIKEAVDIASKKSNVDIKLVNVGIAGQHIKSQQHSGVIVRSFSEDEITTLDLDRLRDDMQKLVMQPGEEIIHVIAQEYTVDSETGIKHPIGMAGVRLQGNFHVITGQVTAAKNIYRCVNKAGLEVSDLILEPIASSDSVLTDEEKEAGVALVDIGGGTTDIAIFHDGIIRHTAVIPLGGNIITDDIKEGCAVMKKQAELLKVKFGCALADETKDNEIISIPGLKGRDAKEISVKNLSHIIQARMEEIFEHVYYEIKASNYEKKLIGGIVVTGGGAQLKHISQLIEFVTSLNARVGYPNEHLSGKGMTEEVKSPMYATGIGLVMRGFTELESKASKNDNKETIQQPKQKTGSWFTDFMKKGKSWMEDETAADDFSN
ncbi:MAG: cell division protein FtsA [Bacteroidetes bacterium]|nr:cell division protein FtsA [Bacteroidota bacterium]